MNESAKMSFCRITGRSRGLPKPNYFPLLTPISPGDARRFCRITGKAYGLPSHHYIPVILTTFSKNRKCKITSAGSDSSHYKPDVNYGKRKHIILTDYRYVFPVFDEADELQKNLMNLLNTKDIDGDNFVYRVEERKCNLVFPAKLEAAVRDGDVKDVMLAKDSDTVLLKMKQGRNVSVDLQEYDVSVNSLLDGEGPKYEVIMEREAEEKENKRKHKKRKQHLSQITQIFEKKEQIQDEEDQKELAFKRAKEEKTKSKLNGHKERSVEVTEEALDSMRSKCNLYLASGDWRDLIKPVIESWDWETYEKEMSCLEIKPIVSTLPGPCCIDPIFLTPNELHIDTSKLDGTTGFDSTSYIGPMTKQTINSDIINSIKSMQMEDLRNLENLTEKILNDPNLLNVIPKKEELVHILENIAKGTSTEINKVPGLTLQIDKAREIFLTGQMVSTPTGNIFVPGQAILTPSGLEYVPGFTVATDTGSSFIPGMLTSADDGTNSFVTGQIIDEHFVCGQLSQTTMEPKFVEGQTVKTGESFKFVPGIFNSDSDTFVPGQNIQTSDGLQFVPGQTMTNENGDHQFLPGQNIFDDKEGWTFVPGQTLDGKFIAGKSVITEKGSKFIPGQFVGEHFVPGVTQNGQFQPGINVETKQGCKFIDGQMIASVHGDIFVPGKSIMTNAGACEFTQAKNIDEIVFKESINTPLIIDPSNIEYSTPSLSVYGHMVQTANGVEFYPDGTDLENISAGKLIPGKLIKQENESKFVPGIMEKGGFIPGQVVWTDKGEQFIPGQVIETDEGLKFVPGQVIETKSGSKFVPGQSIETPEGVRFVPGQIVHTKAGPTFIPGQVISTEEEGERFVPGQVVDTEDGPRFVPGRVIETGDKITFIPGQIVQTDQGPRFVAPDLSDIEGKQQFSVQSFLVTPEELKLIKPSQTWTTPTSSKGELSVDAQMLRQLSEAGMTIGRHIEASTVDIILQSTRDRQVVEQLAKKLNLPSDQREQLHKVFKQIQHFLNTTNEKCQNGVISPSGEIAHMNGFSKNTAKINDIDSNRNNNMNGDEHQTDDTMQIVDTIVSTVLSVMRSNELPLAKNSLAERFNSNSSYVYELISKELEQKMGQINLLDLNVETTSKSIENMIELRLNEEVECIIHIRKVNLINEIIGGKSNDNQQILDSVTTVLDNDDMIKAIEILVHNEPAIIQNVVKCLQENSNEINDHTRISDDMRKTVISAVRKTSVDEIKKMATSQDKTAIEKLVTDAIALSKALGYTDVSTTLNGILSNSNIDFLTMEQDSVSELLQRVLVMRKLSKNNPLLEEALNNMITDPYSARKDSKIRELIRQSGVVTISLGEKVPLVNSSDVPISYLCSDNQLAMEDFLLRRQTKCRGAFLIVKEGIQAVVPRELSRDVLTGKCAYTVLDENGIRHFEPLHVFSALKLNAPLTSHRFSIYSCDMGSSDDFEIESVLTSTCSTLSNNIQFTTANGSVPTIESARQNLDNTPMLKKRRLIESCSSKNEKVIALWVTDDIIYRFSIYF